MELEQQTKNNNMNLKQYMDFKQTTKKINKHGLQRNNQIKGSKKQPKKHKCTCSTKKKTINQTNGPNQKTRNKHNMKQWTNMDRQKQTHKQINNKQPRKTSSPPQKKKKTKTLKTGKQNITK